MNYDQVTGIIRAVAPAALAYCVGKGWISQSDVGEITAALVAVGAAIWSVINNQNVNGASPSTGRVASPGNRPGGAIGAIAVLMIAPWFLFGHSAHAQTAPKPAPVIVTKAPPAAPSCTVNGCRAWYVLADITTHVANVDIIGNGLNGSLAAGGATPHIGVGGFAWNGTYSYGVEAACGYSFNVAGPGAISNGYDCYQEIQLGGNLAGLFNIAPAQTSGNFLTSALMFPYVAVGPEENRTIKTGWRAGASVKFMLDNLTFIDIGYRAVNGGPQSNVVSVTSKSVTNTDNQMTVKLQKSF